MRTPAISGNLAEAAARERVTPELQARAQSLAAHAADSIAGAVRAGDNAGVVRRLQPFIDNDTVAAIGVTSTSGRVLFHWHRDTQPAAGTLWCAPPSRCAPSSRTSRGR